MGLLELVRKLPYDHPYRWDGRVFGRPRLWTPSEIPLQAWFDAYYTSTIVESGGLVSQWNDRSGLGRNLLQPTGAYQPTTGIRAVNGVNVLSFNGGNSMIHTADAAEIFKVGKEVFIFALAATDNGVADYQMVVYFNDSAVYTTGNKYDGIGKVGTTELEAHQMFYTSGTKLATFIVDGSSGPNSTGNSAVFGLSQPQILGTRISRIPSDLPVYARVNGGVESGSAAGTANKIVAQSMMIGSHGSTDSALQRWLTGLIGEVIIAHDIDSATLELIEGYLAWKWALEGNLPVGHPYQLMPPLAA